MHTDMKRASSDRDTLARILDISRDLARPMDLEEMLTEVVKAACAVLQAERCTVWLYDEAAEEFQTKVLIGAAPIRTAADRGLVGACARTREVINVPDCYADPRFDQSIDRQTGYRTRSLMSVPLVGYDDELIGVMQTLNHINGPFDDTDVATATALAAQSAVALQRARMIEGLLVKERLEQELEVARKIQMGTWPREMPVAEGYDLHGASLPAEETGGDTFDIIRLDDQRYVLLLADAAGHGVGPALSVTQVRSMLRMCARLGCDLKRAFDGINRQLVEDLPPELFVTAFLGMLDATRHEIEYLSGGQGPLLFYRRAQDEVEYLKPMTLPLGIMETLPGAAPARITLASGDILALLTDGILEAERSDGEQFGAERTAELLREHRDRPMSELAMILHEQARAFSDGAPQADDVTFLLIKRH